MVRMRGKASDAHQRGALPWPGKSKGGEKVGDDRLVSLISGRGKMMVSVSRRDTGIGHC
jgi:hypothetical protein